MNRVVVTKAGDTWDILAKDLLGDEHYMTELINANIHFRNVTEFSDGVVLNVPDLRPEAAQISQDLPPWKRVSAVNPSKGE